MTTALSGFFTSRKRRSPLLRKRPAVITPGEVGTTDADAFPFAGDTGFVGGATHVGRGEADTFRRRPLAVPIHVPARANAFPQVPSHHRRRNRRSSAAAGLTLAA